MKKFWIRCADVCLILCLLLSLLPTTAIALNDDIANARLFSRSDNSSNLSGDYMLRAELSSMDNNEWESGNGTLGENSPFPFNDVSKTNWAYPSIQYIYQKGLMNGTSSSTFEPDKTVTRGMIVTILYRMAGSPDTGYKIPFYDVSDSDYYADAVRWASENSIAYGTARNMFTPNQALTREQAVTFLYRYTQYEKQNISGGVTLAQYRDIDNISAYARPAMEWAVGLGILNGTDTSTLSPKAKAKRSEIAALFMNYIQSNSLDTVIPGTEQGYVSTIDFEPIDDMTAADYENWKHYARVSGLRSDGITVWERQTDIIYGLNVGYREIGLNGTLFYYTDYRSIFSLDKDTGRSVWTNHDLERIITSDSGFSDVKFGQYGELFICHDAGEGFLAIDQNGQTLLVDDSNGPHTKIINIKYEDNLCFVDLFNDEGIKTVIVPIK